MTTNYTGEIVIETFIILSYVYRRNLLKYVILESKVHYFAQTTLEHETFKTYITCTNYRTIYFTFPYKMNLTMT